MSVADAARAQNRASFPQSSAWVGANAGSGKTRVLTDRVARLLLHGADPQSILCLTYTKAAAAEMKNRLFARLGEWAMLEDGVLRDRLTELGEVEQTHAEGLARARRLFAAALETPGELKIQTIHAFCAAILRRFPLEAGVSPQFREMDARMEADLRAEVLEHLAAQSGGSLAALAEHLPGDGPDGVLNAIRGHQAAFARAYDRAALMRAFAAPPVAAEPLIGKAEADLLSRLAGAIRTAGSATEQTSALPKIDAIARLAGSAKAERLAEGVFLFGATAKDSFGPKRDKFARKDTIAALDQGDVDRINALCEAVATARVARIARQTLARTDALHAFARDYLSRYRALKHARGLLDFDDLIEKVLHLVDEAHGDAAAWVLYKLDGRIEHLLVDEAQDTAPLQWQVIRALTADFFAGHSTRDRPRTVFVVGDEKQSIYSFQGAEPRAFGEMRNEYDAQIDGSGGTLANVALDYSFRSAGPILELVDRVFETPGRGDVSDTVSHLPTDPAKPGRVDIWSWRAPEEGGEDAPWWQPLDMPSEERADLVLAREIAREIARMIRDGDPLPGKDGPRPVTAGDILILLQKRTGVLFPGLIRELKAAGVPVSGADRMKLGEELAVRDLMALMRWVTTPEDDLALAGVLRSPLFGIDEDTLFRLAHGRKGKLIEQLQQTRDLDWIDAVLQDLRGQSDFLRPFEFLSRVLVRHDGRRRILARLGHEAVDGVDELLSQAVAYESVEAPTLSGFLAWFASDETEVKRELAEAQGEVRVMTVHGAKGLEAPVVFLPDTAQRKKPSVPALVDVADQPVWPSAERPEVVTEALDAIADKAARESERLLYVALTRAEHHLIVAGAGKDNLREGGWYGMVAAAAGPDFKPYARGLTLRHNWPEAKLDSPREAPLAAARKRLASPPPPPADQVAVLSPSDLGGAHALPGEGDDPEEAKARGTIVHDLLETLPRLSPDIWEETARRQVPDRPDLVAEALMVLRIHPELFGNGHLSEIAVAGQIGGLVVSGRIDLVVPRPDGSVLIVDFKSNRAIPHSPDAVPEAVKRQLGAYLALLKDQFAPHRVELAILWTATAQLMEMPHTVVMDALARASLDPDKAAP